MFRLARAPDLMLAQHWINLLQQAGIACHLTGQHLQGVAGEIPVDQCGPDLWLEHERDRDLAMRLIEGDAGDQSGSRSHWCCDSCGEWLEPQFTVCWRCGAERPA
ncbi:DUF2007 domain-containing protein [Paracandidimonas soli]|uniref:Putative signal transducing protein n=1 Tax=Paracandidimonas soli TaxID=1917182 RepID=A0A4R3VDB9_9BURK|nr:DUF2007 domain-containing protein [Paracandidimonas soli]TCV01873.1 putative signal transducing protein [Paracandidimonas soli]